MSSILVQPDNKEQSMHAFAELGDTGVNKFDTTMGGPRLQPINAGCRLCIESEQHHHNCIREIGAGRWSIAKNKVFGGRVVLLAMQYEIY